jgi:F-type H+-transporting ATPase subunit gamma
MANLRDVRLRMRAIEQTLQVTKAMNLISTAKLRKVRKMLADTMFYYQRIKKTMYDILSDAGDIQNEYFQNRLRLNNTAIIVITSDKGLAGGYNANIIKHVNEFCKKVNNPILILVGNVGYRHFIHSNHAIMENFTFHSQIPTIEHAKTINKFIIPQYLAGTFKEIHIVYTHMYSSVKMHPVDRQLLPLNKEKIQEELMGKGEIERIKLSFDFLPSKEEVFYTLAPLYAKGVIYSALVEAYASEQSARMAAMDEASKSADEMLSSLRIMYNRSRQAGITQEISEIVSGTEALAAN